MDPTNAHAAADGHRAVDRQIRSRVLDVDCFVGDVNSAATTVIQRALSGEGGFACLANAHVLTTAQRNPMLRAALDSAWTNFPDGAPVAWHQWLAGRTTARRIGGPDLMPTVLDQGRPAGITHFLLGSTSSVIQALEARLTEQFAGVEIVGTYAPDPGTEDDRECFDRIRAARPHVVWVALGAPKQELWMRRASDKLRPSLMLGVGAAFDFHAGSKRRAPKWMQRVGLEWLHRLGQEPRRLLRRYTFTNIAFVLRATQIFFRSRVSARKR
jgi:N-acetylglucosaminyldiphosphoundecaprenol N-acetyl-beta-D-mannosaminyltransferase